MNDPHTAHVMGDEIDYEAQYQKLGLYIDTVWTSDDLTPEEKADLIRTAALRLLQGESEPEEVGPHAGGIPLGADQKALESDATALMGGDEELDSFLDRIAPPRKMSREELRAAARRITGDRTLEDDILEAINRRQQRPTAKSLADDARALMGEHSHSYHQ